MALSVKNKLAFVNGSLPQPQSSSPNHETWIRCNHMVISWLLNSISKDLADSVLYIETDAGIWEDLTGRFSQRNGPQIFQVHKSIASLSQGQHTVPTSTDSAPHSSADITLSPDSIPLPRRSSRLRQTPSYLEEYHCQLALSSTVKPVVVSLPDSHLSTDSSTPAVSHLAGAAYPISDFLSYANLSPSHQAFVLSVSTHSEPSSFKEAVVSPEWKAAMVKEIEALELNNTWTVCSLPPGHTPIDCKWVYKLKYHANGSIERYKARLVAKGYTQKEGFDYFEAFSPVAKLTSVRLLLALAASKQ